MQFQSILLLLLCSRVLLSAAFKRKWDYEMHNIETYTSDPSKFIIDFRTVRLSRTESALSGTVNWKYATDDTTMFFMHCYSSYSGSVSDYRKLPYEIPKTSILDGFNKFYDDVVIGNFGNCSDLPKFENGFTNPMPQGLYTLETCVANGNGLPEVLPQGFYKIHIEFVGEVNWKLIFYFKITPKLLA